MPDAQTLLDPHKYQVFLMACPAHIPVHFAYHPWFVVNKKGVVTRYEVVYKNDCCPGKSFGHIHINALPSFQGAGWFSFSKKHFWKATFISSIEGDEGSLAQQVGDFIGHSIETYPYRDRYVLTGPNSNTYIQWVLGNFPEWKADFSSPKFFGKNYPIKKD